MDSRFLYKRQYKNIKFLTCIILFSLASVIFNFENDILVVGFIVLIVMIVIKNEREELLLESKLTAGIHKIRYRLAIEMLDAAIWEWYEDEGLLYISSRMREVLETNEVIDNFPKFKKFIYEEDLEKADEIYENFIKKNKIGNLDFEIRLRTESGKIIPYKVSGNSKIDSMGSYFINGVALDLSDKKHQEKLLEESEKNYRRALLGTKDIVFCLDTKTSIMILNGNVMELFGKEKLNMNLEEWLRYLVDEDEYKMLDFFNCWENREEDYYEVEFRINCKGAIHWISLRGKRFIEEGETLIYGSLSDISDRKEKEDKINYMSYYDEVTGIPNRRYFTEKVTRRISLCLKRRRNLAIVFIDLDNFKYINDTYGHDIGDELLVSICNTIYDLLGVESCMARFGGDEFVLSIENFNSKDELEDILNEIIKISTTPMVIDNKKIYCTLSMGVTVLRVDGYELKTLLKKSDVAMYNAKSLGKNQYNFFDRDVSDKINREFKIKEGLRNAIYDKELFGMLQPKVDIESMEIEGFEYLIRWISSEMGFISPGEFIPIAESSGQIVDIGNYVLNDAVGMIKELRGMGLEDFKIAINLSEVQIRDESIVKNISDILLNFEIDPKNVEIEITESVIMQCAEKNIDTLRNLKNLGITIALDDFGTGYSSLSYLRILPIDVLKIDKSFVDYINKDEKSEYIIRKIIELSHNLNVRVVAEGVETKEQFEYLRDIGCDSIQGYYFSKPLAYEDVVSGISRENKKVNSIL